MSEIIPFENSLKSDSTPKAFKKVNLILSLFKLLLFLLNKKYLLN